MFEEIEFTAACEELDSPEIDGWELFTDSNNVKIYRLYNESTGLYSYKIYGELVGIRPDVCAKVYNDLDYRRQWDSYVKDLREIAEDDRKGIYWQVKFPFPLSNRDYTFLREQRELDVCGQHVWVILGKAAVFSTVPVVKGVVRVSEYLQSLAITTGSDGGTKAFMRYYDNPGGMIPAWLINWAAKTGVPNFLSTMQKACEGYEGYLRKKSQD